MGFPEELQNQGSKSRVEPSFVLFPGDLLKSLHGAQRTQARHQHDEDDLVLRDVCS